MAQTAKTCVECEIFNTLISCPFIWLYADVCSFNCFCVALNDEQHLGEAFYTLFRGCRAQQGKYNTCCSYTRQHSRVQINMT